MNDGDADVFLDVVKINGAERTTTNPSSFVSKALSKSIDVLIVVANNEFCEVFKRKGGPPPHVRATPRVHGGIRRFPQRANYQLSPCRRKKKKKVPFTPPVGKETSRPKTVAAF